MCQMHLTFSFVLEYEPVKLKYPRQKLRFFDELGRKYNLQFPSIFTQQHCSTCKRLNETPFS